VTNSNWHQEETYKSLMLYGNNAVKYVLLVNGGAVISILTFLGNFLKDHKTSINMGWPMACFLIGIVVGGMAHITAYLTQFVLYNEGNGDQLKFKHTVWLYTSLVLVVIGILLFGVGSVLALLELRSYT